MVTVKNVGAQGVPLNGKFLYPGEHRTVMALAFQRADQAHPGFFEVLSSTEEQEVERADQGLPQSPAGESDVVVEEQVDPQRGRGRGKSRSASVMEAGSDEG